MPDVPPNGSWHCWSNPGGRRGGPAYCRRQTSQLFFWLISAGACLRLQHGWKDGMERERWKDGGRGGGGTEGMWLGLGCMADRSWSGRMAGCHTHNLRWGFSRGLIHTHTKAHNTHAHTSCIMYSEHVETDNNAHARVYKHVTCVHVREFCMDIECPEWALATSFDELGKSTLRL